MQFYICTPIKVDVKEWNKAQKSKAALTKYLQTDEGSLRTISVWGSQNKPTS